jgi:aromatic ring-opening dioxygenase LigB subunit
MVKGGNNIKFSIDFGLTKPLKSFIYKQYRVLVLNYNSIKSSIINIKLNTSSWLFSEKDGGSY